MRNAVITMVLIAVLIISGIAIFSIENTTTRQNELDSNLSSVMKRSMEIMTIDPKYHIDRDDNEALIADYINNFLLRMNSDSEYKIEILGVDAKKGILSVRVTETYPSLFSKHSVTAERTVVLDRYETGEDKLAKVTFYESYKDGVFENAIRQERLEKGATLTKQAPTPPNKDGYTFTGWNLYKEGTFLGFYNDITGLTAAMDLNFAAVYEKDAIGIYTVTLLADNDELQVLKVREGETIGTHTAAPAKEGYTFKGWSSTKGELLTDSELTNMKVSRHIKYQALYDKN
ncbi:MAG: InlB B-repeat-containing protein [Anaerovoracaceae bacterium]